MSERVLHLDFETYSGTDLRKAGIENYIGDADFAVTAMAWAFDDGPVEARVWPHCSMPLDVRAHIHAGGTIKAWNASFEWNVLTSLYGVDVSLEQMDCTMQRALAWGLPASLQDAGDALKLAITKDKTAKKLMQTMGRPRKDGTGWHHDQSLKAKVMLADLSDYCRQDVEAERAASRVIPALSLHEKTLSVLDARTNQLGVLVDMSAVAALRRAAQYEKVKVGVECGTITNGKVTSPGTQTERMHAWLDAQGVHLDDLSKETVAEALALKLDDHVRRVLELRQLAAKSSLAKLERMEAVASKGDFRARNLFQFYGAGRTGRWAGRLIQAQNLPRPDKGLEPDKVIDVAKSGFDALGLFYKAPMRAISGALRGCLIARPGHVLVSVDLAQIEARVLAWLAGQTDVLDAFRRGDDIYQYAAALQGSSDRQFGKVLVLACGFGMGATKFKDTAATYGVSLTMYQATKAVEGWRERNDKIRYFWWDIENATQAALGHWNPGARQMGRWTGAKGGVQTVGLVKLALIKGVLGIRKPNGEKLWYHEPRLVPSDNGLRHSFEFKGVNQTSHKWGDIRSYGGKTVENIVQAVARDVMAEGMLLAGRVPVMTVHDEVVWEVPREDAPYEAERLRQCMESPPAWCHGLPLSSDVKISRRYGK